MMKFTFCASVLTAILETLFYGGQVYGWNSISYVLRKENYFASECGNTTATSASNSSSSEVCTQQEESFILIYTCAVVTCSLSSLFYGFTLDVLGTFVTRFIGTFVFTLGLLLVSFSTPESAIMMYVSAMCCIGAGGMAILMSNMPLGGLFPKHRSTILATLNGAFDSSTLVFLMVKIGYENQITLRSCFLILVATTTFIWLRTFTLMPLKHVPFAATEDYEISVISQLSHQKEKEFIEERSDVSKELVYDKDNNNKKSTVSLMSCICSVNFILYTVFFSLCLLRMNIYFSTSGPWLLELSEGDDDLFSSYTDALGTVLLFGCFCAPLNGILIDRLIAFYQKDSKCDERRASIKALGVSLLVTSILIILLSLSTCIPIPFFTYSSFFLLILSRAFFFGGMSTYIANLFPSQHFGMLYGLTDCIGATVSILQYPLGSFVLVTLEGNFVLFNIGTVIVCLLTLVNPMVLLLKARNKKKCIDDKEYTTPTETNQSPNL